MDDEQNVTRKAFIWTNVLRAPFWALYSLLVFILYKDLHATGLHVAAFLSLKPLVSIFSVYWSQLVVNRRDRLQQNIIFATLLGYLPFFFFPIVDAPWFFVFAGALYMMLTRGVVPAWMEIIKVNLPNSSREEVVSWGCAISYLGGAIFPLCFGPLLVVYPDSWRWLFPATAALGLCSTFFQLGIQLAACPAPAPGAALKSGNEQQHVLVRPWKTGWTLFSRRADFRQFQIGFFLGGTGLMLMQPALPRFFCDTLNLSYAELAVALSLCKGLGFAFTTRFWASLLRKVNIFKFCSLVTLLASLFPLGLLLAQYHHGWLYIAYLSYGVMQAGSELGWHFSGPIFAGAEDSAPYSSLNIATVGVRGCVAPFLGSLACAEYGAAPLLLVSSLLCLASMAYMHHCSERHFFEKIAGG